jgi:hypothetical protein
MTIRAGRALTLILVCLVAASPVFANCVVSLQAPATVASSETYDVKIVPAAGDPHNYVFTESWGEVRMNPTETPSARSRTQRWDALSSAVPFQGAKLKQFSHVATYDMPVTYRVVATNSYNQSEVCSAEAIVLVKADPELTPFTLRGVIPVVGATGGLNGSRFKTSLKLVGAGKGKLIFHPINRTGSDADPSIPYDLTSNNGIQIFDDLMASFGLSGVGSLDIVPDQSIRPAVPGAEARIYNQTDNGATFGTLEPAMVPAEWMGLDGPDQFRGILINPQFQTRVAAGGSGIGIPPLTPGLRLNVGIRSFTRMAIFVFVRHADGTSQGKLLNVDANALIMGPVEALFFLPPTGPGDSVSILVSSGMGIPFYTLTDNATNDPAIMFHYRGESSYLDRFND